LNYSHNIIWMIESRRMRWVGYIARTEDMRKAYKIVIGNPQGTTAFGKIRC